LRPFLLVAPHYVPFAGQQSLETWHMHARVCEDKERERERERERGRGIVREGNFAREVDVESVASAEGRSRLEPIISVKSRESSIETDTPRNSIDNVSKKGTIVRRS